MKLILICLLLVAPGVLSASQRAPSLENILDCSKSVFYGEVISGAIDSKPSDVKGETDQVGSYSVKVINQIAGKKIGPVANLNAEFSAAIIGGFVYTYPAPGLKYIFIVFEENNKLYFSPYHLPAVENIQNHEVVTGGAHGFINGVKFYYRENGWQLKEENSDAGDFKGKYESIVGYDFSSYQKSILKKFGKCQSK